MLGPSLFGDYKFLLFSFTQVTNFLGTGNTFLAIGLAKNKNDKNLISFYWAFIFTIAFLGCIILVPVLNSNLYKIIFPGQNIVYIWIAFLLVLSLFVAQILESMSDACGLTTKGSVVTILSRAIGVFFLLLFFFIFNQKTILFIFWANFVSAFFLIGGFILVLKLKNIPIFHFNISFYELKQKFILFYKYSGPLFFLSMMGLPINFLNRWILQSFGGSLQQGYFSLSDSLSSFVIMFSGSIAPLLLRELSISFKNEDLNRMRSLFNKSISFVFATSAFFSIFILLNASKATHLLGGKSFGGAILPVSIMLLYPIPYTTNNILYSYIYSANKTGLLRNIMLICSFIGLIITFFLVAPKNYFGLGLGATGFAISTVLGTSIVYLVLLKYCAFAMQLRWLKIIGNHIVVIILFLAIGISTVKLGELFINDSMISFVLSGLLYSLGAMLLLLKFPKLIGISFREVYELIRPMLKK